MDDYGHKHNHSSSHKDFFPYLRSVPSVWPCYAIPALAILINKFDFGSREAIPVMCSKTTLLKIDKVLQQARQLNSGCDMQTFAVCIVVHLLHDAAAADDVDKVEKINSTCLLRFYASS